MIGGQQRLLAPVAILITGPVGQNNHDRFVIITSWLVLRLNTLALHAGPPD